MIIDGRKIAAQIEAQLKSKIKPGLTLAILVLPDDKAGQVYTRVKKEAAERTGIRVLVSNQPEILPAWANDKAVTGILIQYPGWRGEEFNKQWQKWVNKIPPEKDVDGLRPASPAGGPGSPFIPATVRATELILKKIKAKGKILVVGRGMIGRALTQRLKAKNISSHDENLADECLKADILITACGRPGLIKTVKPGATVIDCGWPKGDVDFTAVTNTAGAITPVPGGVGPVTVVCLLENLIEAVYSREDAKN